MPGQPRSLWKKRVKESTLELDLAFGEGSQRALFIFSNYNCDRPNYP